MAKLEEMGEFVRSASSTIEAPVVRRLKEAFNGGGRRSPAVARASVPRPRRRPAARDQGGDGRPSGDRGPGQVCRLTASHGAAPPSAPARPGSPGAGAASGRPRPSAAGSFRRADAAGTSVPRRVPRPPRPAPPLPTSAAPAGVSRRRASRGAPGRARASGGQGGPAAGGRARARRRRVPARRVLAVRSGPSRQTQRRLGPPRRPARPGAAPRPGAPAAGRSRAARPASGGPRPGNNPFSSTATGMGSAPAAAPRLRRPARAQ